MIKLVCPECRRENEPERIYCHDCGARLDRTALKKEKPKEEEPQETQRRLKILLDPRRAILRKRFFQGCKLLLGALVAAGLVQMLRSPNLPEKSKTPEMPSQINLELENAAMDARAAAPHYNQEQVNAYLAYALKGKQTALSQYLQFERAVVAFDEGSCRLTVERSLFGYPVFTSATYAPSIQAGNVVLKLKSGQIGRMPVHPALMQYSDVLFADLRGALERERKSIVKLGGVEVHPQTVAFLPRPPST